VSVSNDGLKIEQPIVVMMSKFQPLLTAIIPAYNVAPYIREAVDSVLHQTMRDIDVVVVDDGSTDDTVERLKRIRDPRLRIVRQRNAGLAGARNTGIGVAAAPYLGFLDGDDFWAPTKVERHLDFLKLHPEIDLTWSLSTMVDEKGREIGLAAPRSEGTASFHEVLVGDAVCNGGSAVVARRQAIERAGIFDTTLLASEDVDMWLRIAMLRPNNMYCIAEPLTFYRRRPGQLSGDWRRIEAGWQQLAKKMERLAPKEFGLVEATANCRSKLYCAFLAHEQGQHVHSSRLLWTSFRSNPRDCCRRVESWLLAGACLAGMLLPPPVHRKLTRFGARLHRWVLSR